MLEKFRSWPISSQNYSSYDHRQFAAICHNPICVRMSITTLQVARRGCIYLTRQTWCGSFFENFSQMFDGGSNSGPEFGKSIEQFCARTK